ncbi:uncharacterized protein LOC104583528 isoform X1 [Brachypodium distachyon]|uniref:uncharacterized protein LOC104583528 isoform X1 n=1 Tax=Brachypodium distachyon TaxID=15368 RepID=UPI00052FF727|nr:uncharacterized protein LOC104583528 isoform X1 [Brachypodium distachyon]|eukprot:XP_010234252.1 uncharacterized protein LOC104583528 isoform X1 [Brachypodium distachyon]
MTPNISCFGSATVVVVLLVVFFRRGDVSRVSLVVVVIGGGGCRVHLGIWVLVGRVTCCGCVSLGLLLGGDGRFWPAVLVHGFSVGWVSFYHCVSLRCRLLLRRASSFCCGSGGPLQRWLLLLWGSCAEFWQVHLKMPRQCLKTTTLRRKYRGFRFT